MLIGAYLVSGAGTWLYRLTLPLLVLELTGSALQTAVLYALEYGPFLLLSLPGGVLADRVDRRRLLVLGDVLAGVVAGGLAVLLTTGLSSLAAIYLAAFLVGCVEPIYHPAFQAMLPEVTPQRHLERANAVMQSGDNVLSLAGPALAGTLIAFAGYEVAIYVDAGSFLLSALILLFLKRTAVSAEDRSAPARLGQDLREAVRYVARDNRTLLAGSLLFTGTNFAIWLIQANLVFFLTSELDLSPGEIGLVFAAQGVGSLLGAMAAPRVIRRLGNGRTITTSTMIAGVLTLGMAVAPEVISFSLVSAAVFALGSMNVVSWFSLRQRIVPGRLMGRVVAVTRMLAFSSIPLSALVAGGLVEALGSVVTVIVIGAVLRFVVGLVGSRSSVVTDGVSTGRPI